MSSLNKVLIIGNLTRDPELKYTTKGTAVTDVSVAVNDRYKSPSGETRENTTFIGVVVFGRGAEALAEYTKKGSKILVEGRLSQDQWEDKQTGKKVTKTKVVCENFQFLSPKGDNSGNRGSQGRDFGGTSEEYRPSGGMGQNKSSSQTPDNQEDEDDDIPF